jgi:hypothetical protein
MSVAGKRGGVEGFFVSKLYVLRRCGLNDGETELLMKQCPIPSTSSVST